MADARLVATNPVDSSLVAVACTPAGLLKTEGGPEGPQGPKGDPGPPGPSFELPPDPYEGAFLGWLNGELSWIGNSPVPIPEGVFGPITSWDSQSGLLTVDGEVPPELGNGVYIWQCEADGTYFTAGLNVSNVWSDGSDYTGSSLSYGTLTGGGFTSVVGDVGVGSVSSADLFGCTSGTVSWTGSIAYSESIAMWCYTNPDGIWKFTIDGVEYDVTSQVPVISDGQPGSKTTFTSLPASGTITKFEITSTDAANGKGFTGWYVDGRLLVDTSQSLNLRINQVIGNTIVGVPSMSTDFTVGKYLRVPTQRVAPWVFRETTQVRS